MPCLIVEYEQAGLYMKVFPVVFITIHSLSLNHSGWCCVQRGFKGENSCTRCNALWLVLFFYFFTLMRLSQVNVLLQTAGSSLDVHALKI